MIRWITILLLCVPAFSANIYVATTGNDTSAGGPDNSGYRRAAKIDQFTGTDPLAFVVSMNLKRRHLNESQRAMIAAKIANMKPHDNQHTKGDGQICRTSPVSQHDAADLLNVSERTVRSAKSVQEHGTKELVESIRRLMAYDRKNPHETSKAG